MAWVSGTCATLFKSEVQFGHAGARSGSEMESAQAKNGALRDAGAVVPDSFEGLEAAIKWVPPSEEGWKRPSHTCLMSDRQECRRAPYLTTG